MMNQQAVVVVNTLCNTYDRSLARILNITARLCFERTYVEALDQDEGGSE